MQGYCAPEFEHVAEAFEANAAASGEDSAAMALAIEGEIVVDVSYGDWADDSLVCVFSCTKGMAALVAMLLVDRGLLSLDEPVAAYWPEFAAEGKEGVLVRHVLNHTVGLVTVPRYWEAIGVDSSGLLDQDVMAAALAGAPLSWEPGRYFAYHALTYGYLLGELVRRVDPGGRTIGQVFADEVAGPLGLSLWLGLPDDVAAGGRVLDSLPPLDGEVVKNPSEELLQGGVPASIDGWLWASVFAPLSVDNVAEWLTGFMNRPDTRRAEIPGANAIGDARSLALMYAPLAGGGGGLVSPEVLAAFTAPQHLPDGARTEIGLGFGWYDVGFGHSGAGGSLGMADPSRRLSYGYAKNRMLADIETPWRPLRSL